MLTVNTFRDVLRILSKIERFAKIVRWCKAKKGESQNGCYKKTKHTNTCLCVSGG